MRRILSASLFALCVGVQLSGARPAMAGEQDFTLHNATGMAITHLYISENDNNDWEEDVLGVDTLADGDNTKIEFAGSEECKWDIKITNEDGAEFIVQDVDLCSTHNIAFAREGNTVAWASN